MCDKITTMIDYGIIPVWFDSLNAKMQRRVQTWADDSEVIDHVFLWYPKPCRLDHAWIYPIRGEICDDWLLEDFTDLQAFIQSGEVRLKKITKTFDSLNTDISLCANDCAKSKPRFSECENVEAHIEIRPSRPEVDLEDLAKYGDAAIQLVHDIKFGETIRWADAVNTAASMDDLENE
jgi:hypothetical protein